LQTAHPYEPLTFEASEAMPLRIARKAAFKLTRNNLETTRETDFSTQQDRPQAPPRLPCSHGDQRRHEGDCGPPRARTQAPFRLTPAARSQSAVMQRLLKRRDFLKVQKGRRVHTGLFSVQSLPRQDILPSRAGFTVSKKVDPSAVKRNRIRRRLKEAMRLDPVAATSCGMDFVIVAKPDALHAPFTRIRSDLTRAFADTLKPFRSSQKAP
jgi:ribonuclease P protein component